MQSLPAGPGRSLFADERAARQAVGMALPLIEKAMQDKAVGESGFLHIVVLDPAAQWGVDDFADAILYEYSVGDRSRWDADYAAFARAKARVCWRTGRDGHGVRSVSPHLLRTDDCGIWGGVCVDGIVVGAAGANPWYDEAFAACVAHCLKAVAKGRAVQAPERPWLAPEPSAARAARDGGGG